MSLQGLGQVTKRLLHDALVACLESFSYMAVCGQTRVQMRGNALRVDSRTLPTDTEVLWTFHNRFLEFVPLALLGYYWRACIT